MAASQWESDPSYLQFSRGELLAARSGWVREIRGAKALGVVVDEREEMQKLMGWMHVHSPPLEGRTLDACMRGVHNVKLLVAAARAELASKVATLHAGRVSVRPE